jgi:ring-1,2-phenylacetyl-CoA epoxidase subunit PaaD
VTAVAIEQPADAAVTSPESTVAQAISRIPDPEVPVISIADLGILRSVDVDDASRTLVATVTPTYSGCPAMEAITDRIVFAAREHGYDATVRTLLSPPWTTDWITEEGREALHRFGIAPPGPASEADAPGPVLVRLARHVVACPRCGSDDTTEIAHFGSTACKALRRCNACLEPFDEFKAL